MRDAGNRVLWAMEYELRADAAGHTVGQSIMEIVERAAHRPG